MSALYCVILKKKASTHWWGYIMHDLSAWRSFATQRKHHMLCHGHGPTTVMGPPASRTDEPNGFFLLWLSSFSLLFLLAQAFISLIFRYPAFHHPNLAANPTLDPCFWSWIISVVVVLSGGNGCSPTLVVEG